MRDEMQIIGDIVGPVGAFEGLRKPKRRLKNL